MAADEQRRELHLDLDLAELKLFHSISQRPSVRSLLCREIENLEEKILQKKVLPNDIRQCTSSKFSVPQQEASEIAEKGTVHFSNEVLTIKLQETIENRNNQVMIEGNASLKTQFAERGSKRKHKEIDNSRSSKWEKMPKLNSIKRPLIINRSSCKITQEEEPNQESLQRGSKQVLHFSANPFDANESSPTTVVVIENADICNQTHQVIPDRNKQLEEDCDGNTCETNPGVPLKKFPSRSAHCKYAQKQFKKEMKYQAGELHETANPSDANKVYPMEVAAPKNADICNQTSEAILDRNKQLEDRNGNTSEANTGVPPKKIPSRSARRKYAQRQLKKKMRNQARELHERANPSDTNEASPIEVAAIQNADIRNQTSQVIPDRNRTGCNGNTREPSFGVSTGKFPIRSPPHEYAQRKLKNEMNKQPRGSTELQYMRNDGDVTTNQTRHIVRSGRRQPLPPTYLDFMQRKANVDPVCLERLPQASSPGRIKYRSHHPAPAALSYSSSSYQQLVEPSYSRGGQFLEQNLPYKNSWNSASAEASRELLWKPTGNANTWFRENAYLSPRGRSAS